MKKNILILSIFFAIQILCLLCIALPKDEPVVWAQNDYGEYEISACVYGEDVLQKIQQTVSDYKTAQSEKYLTDSERQMVLVDRSRVLCNANGITVVEYQTQRRTYTSLTDGVFTGNELLETAQLWITETSNGASVEIRPADCGAAVFTNERIIRAQRNAM